MIAPSLPLSSELGEAPARYAHLRVRAWGLPAAVLLLVAGCVVVFAYRVHCFADLEPRTDQASAARLVQELRTDHFMPASRAERSFVLQLAGDPDSGLNRLLRYFFLTPHFMLSSLSLAYFYLGSWLLGDNWRAFVLLSIAASVVTLAVTTLWAYYACRGFLSDGSRAAGLIGAAGTFVAGAFCGYAHLFSPWGVHNVGVLALVAAGYVSSRCPVWSTRSSRWCWSGLAQVCAIYTHWTNLILLPPATVLAALVSPRAKPRKRVLFLATYAGATLVVVLPVIVLLAIKPQDFVYAGYSTASGSFDLASLASRAGGWFTAANRYFSIPGFALGIAGAILLGLWQGVWIPAAVIAAHWFAWAALPGFTWNGSPTELRTYNYLLPFLWLGIGVAVASALTCTQSARARALVLPATGFLLLAHLVLQLPLFGGPADVAVRLPLFYESYLCGQGRLRAVVRSIDARVPRRATILASDYPLQDVYFVLSHDRRPGAVVLTLWQRAKTHRLATHLAKYGYTTDCSSLYALLRPGQPGDSPRAVGAVLGANGFRCPERYHWKLLETYPVRSRCDYLGEIDLYRLQPAS